MAAGRLLREARDTSQIADSPSRVVADALSRLMHFGSPVDGIRQLTGSVDPARRPGRPCDATTDQLLCIVQRVPRRARNLRLLDASHVPGHSREGVPEVEVEVLWLIDLRSSRNSAVLDICGYLRYGNHGAGSMPVSSASSRTAAPISVASVGSRWPPGCSRRPYARCPTSRISLPPRVSKAPTVTCIGKRCREAKS